MIEQTCIANHNQCSRFKQTQWYNLHRHEKHHCAKLHWSNLL